MWLVKNLDNKPIYFSIGAHPALKCPIVDVESFDDCYLQFNAEEISSRILLLPSRPLSRDRMPTLNGKTLDLNYELFKGNALVFDDLKSDEITICAEKIFKKYNCAVLAKGGYGINNADDLLFDGNLIWFNGKRIDTKNAHGTGRTLSSAIAANLAKNFTLRDSVDAAKKYLTKALKAGLNLGHGNGPINHLVFD